MVAAKLLHEGGFQVVGLDVRGQSGPAAFACRAVDLASNDGIGGALDSCDAVLSCLPYRLNRDLAAAAHRLGIHYFDLTEDVSTTLAVKQLGATARGVMAPQCGLAPGFIGIVGAAQIGQFDTCRSLRLRVGALPQNPTGLMGYAFNWSPEGVVNEYLNDCEVIEDGVHKFVSAMEWKETIYVDGKHLEAFTTSGGLGTMCETYLGVVDNLDYKTIRYPGHMDLMNFFFHELLMRERRELAGDILTTAKPPVDADVVYVHVAAEGWQHGKLRRTEYVRAFHPIDVGGRRSTAIAWTTAGSVAAVIELVRSGALPQQGFIKQENIPLDAFLATPTGALFTR